MAVQTSTREVTPQDDDEESIELVRLTNINVVATGLVDRAANRTRFFAVKRADMATKQVPRDGMTNEQLHEAQESRSKEYGIEILDGASLTFPKDYPERLDEYGDPVNLAYPVDTADRARNARVRFKQSFAAYQETASRNVVHERIVRAELAFGIKPNFDPDDELDAALPEDVREKLTGSRKQENGMDPKAMMQEILGQLQAGQAITEEQLAKLNEAAAMLTSHGAGEPPAAEPPALPSDQDAESQQMAAKAEQSARDRAREILWTVLDDINNGAVDSEEDKAIRAKLLEAIRAAVAVKMEMTHEQMSSHKAGRPQFSKARMGELMAAYQALGKVLESVNAMAAEEMTEGDASQKADRSAEVEALKASLAARDGEIVAKMAEIRTLKTAHEALTRRAAPSALFGVEGSPPLVKPEPAKRVNPLNMQLGRDD